jgi:hypothetical protein
MNSEDIVPREEFENFKGVVYGYISSHISGRATGSDVSHVTGSDVSHVTGSMENKRGR